MRLPEEYKLNLCINGSQKISFICSDVCLEEMSIGWLYNEGLISSMEDVEHLNREGSEAEVRLNTKAPIPQHWSLTRSSGMGGQTLELDARQEACSVGARYAYEDVRIFAKQMDQLCLKYAETGGMHCSAVFDNTGLRSHFEDIGRHNTLDKVAGHSLMKQEPLDGCLLITTGRISADMVKKAGRMGIAVIASYTTATENARQLAQNLGITLIGYLSRKGRNIYCCEDRIL